MGVKFGNLKLVKLFPVGFIVVGVKFLDSQVVFEFDFFLGFDTSGLAIWALSWWAAFCVPLFESQKLEVFFLGQTPVPFDGCELSDGWGELGPGIG